MNLVQIQERLKDAPVQAIMQYANGMNPMVPPYLALAELKRRESINQSAQAQQAMQQGQQPSVKEQVEQAAGLAALQQQMQQQGMQGLMAQARPQGIPENVPQPRRQPESEGIAGLPAGDFNFADGGIVAFQGGGETGVMSIEQMRAEYQRLLRANRRVEANEMLEKIKTRQEMERRPITTPVAPMDEAMPTAPQAAVTPPAEAPEGAPPATRMPGQLPPPGGIAGQIALPAGRTMEQRLPMGTPEVMSEGYSAAKGMPERALMEQPRGIAALPGAEQAGKMMVEAMQKQSTPEEIYQAGSKLKGLYGLTQPYGEDRMQRLSQLQTERQKMLEDRGMERLMRVMGGIAGRGLQGAAPAYLSAIEGERASDLAFRKQMDELLGGVEEKRRAEALADMQRATTQMGKERELSLGAAEKLFDAETRRKNEEFRIRLENQLRSMQPTEATILQRMIDDEMRRNPKLTLVEAYAKVKEAQQGATPEAKARATQKDLLELALKEWNDQLIPMKDKNPRNLTQEQWLQEKMRTYGSAMPSGIGGGMGGSSAKPQKPLTAYER